MYFQNSQRMSSRNIVSRAVEHMGMTLRNSAYYFILNTLIINVKKSCIPLPQERLFCIPTEQYSKKSIFSNKNEKLYR